MTQIPLSSKVSERRRTSQLTCSQISEEKKPFSEPLERRALRMVVWAGAASMACTALTLGLLLFSPTAFSSEPLPSSLEFASPYIGLERAIHHSNESLPPIVNFPILMAQIDSSQPHKVFYDTHRWDSSFGMIYPRDRRFEVSPTVLTSSLRVIKS